MKLKTLLLATTCSLGIGGAAYAFDQSLIDSIASELAGQGYTHMEVKITPNGAKVEASGPNGEIKRQYDNAGNLLKEERDDSRDSSDGRDGSSTVIGGDDYDDDAGDDYDDDESGDDSDDSDDDRNDDSDDSDDGDDDRSDDRDDDRDDDSDDEDDDEEDDD